MRRSTRELAKLQIRRLFELGQRAGVDVLPRHYYSQVPDIRQMRRTDRWKRPYTMFSVAGADVDQQLEFVRQSSPPQLVAAAADVHEHACRLNEAEGYGPIEAQFLYCFGVSHRPARVVQVGAGVSTAVLLRAATDAGYVPRVTCIDPFPTGYLRSLADQGTVQLFESAAQDVPLETLTDLGPGDLLFIDSTHTVRPGGEVSRLIVEVLPRLRPGVFVQFHDITFPYDYSPGILDADLFFWNETILLLAFLTNNPSFEMRVAFSMLHDRAPDRLRTILPFYDPESHDRGVATRATGPGHFPSAAYIQSVSAPVHSSTSPSATPSTRPMAS